MKFLTTLFIFVVLASPASANTADSTMPFSLPDTVKAVSFISTIHIGPIKSKKEIEAGIRTSVVALSLEAEKKEREVVFRFPEGAQVVATGQEVEKDEDELEWEYQWKEGVNYRLLILTAADSAAGFVLYSGYIFLPEHDKWKLVGTCRVTGTPLTIQAPARFYSTGKRAIDASFSESWVQRASGSWKNLDGGNLRPSITPMPAYDSLQQFQADIKIIEAARLSGRTDVNRDTAGIYYLVKDAGNGKPVSVSDTVTVRYQLRIFETNEIIDQATEKPATFPLGRLIKAWQIGVPLVKTGGKIKLVIPSGLAYSIRTRSPKIPPNSILEFEIEVLDTKPAK